MDTINNINVPTRETLRTSGEIHIACSHKEEEDCVYAPLIETYIDTEKDIPARNISNGLVDYSLKCIKGIHKSNFLYLNLTTEGELIGSDPNDPNLTVFMENSNLDGRHIQILPKNGGYFLRDLSSSTGTYLKQGNDDPILITDGMEMLIGHENFKFTYGEEIEDEIEEWFKKYNLSEYVHKVKAMNYNSLDQIAEFKMSDFSSLIANREDWDLLAQVISDIRIDLCEGHIRNKLLIKNCDKNTVSAVGWAGASIGSAETSTIKLSSTKHHSSHMVTSLSPSECLILYQFGKYWIANSKRSPIKDLYLKVKGDTEGDEEHEHELRPSDTIKIGSLVLRVNRFNIGKAEDKGNKQRSMEDKSVIIQDFAVSDSLDFSFFAVFDGHSGTTCVRHVAECLPIVLRQYLLKSEGTISEYDLFDQQEKFYSFMNKVVNQSIQETDFAFYDDYGDYSLTSGSTGVIVLIVGDRIICANVGDSRAILSRKRKPICLSRDHKPSDPDEKLRIEEAGGRVLADRVNGVLATSRSFGDFKYKVVSNYSDTFNKQGNGEDIVSCRPEIRTHTIDYTQDEFIVIACDGLYDNLSNQQIIDFVHDKYSAMPIGSQDTQKIVRELVQFAKTTNIKNTNVCDNITTILIPLTRGIEPVAGGDGEGVNGEGA